MRWKVIHEYKTWSDPCWWFVRLLLLTWQLCHNMLEYILGSPCPGYWVHLFIFFFPLEKNLKFYYMWIKFHSWNALTSFIHTSKQRVPIHADSLSHFQCYHKAETVSTYPSYVFIWTSQKLNYPVLIVVNSPLYKFQYKQSSSYDPKDNIFKTSTLN